MMHDTRRGPGGWRSNLLGLSLLVSWTTAIAADIAQWEFDGDLEPSAGAAAGALVPDAASPAFAPVVVFTEDTIVGATARVASFSRGTFFRAPHGLDANGGGAFVNRYTIVMDVMFPDGTTGWQPLYQTNTGNSNDGDWFVQPDVDGSGIGISGSYGGAVEDGAWHRLALVVDLAAGTYTSFVNGERVQENTGLGVDGRFSLDPTVLFFADDSGENAAGFVNSIQIRDEALTEREVAALGGPSADGIPRSRPGPPVPTGLWEFSDAAELGRATVGADLVIEGAAAAVEGSRPSDGAARIGTGSFYRMTHGLAPGVGEAFVNRYTLVFDARVPELGSWYTLFQTNVSNGNDGDCFVNPASSTSWSRSAERMRCSVTHCAARRAFPEATSASRRASTPSRMTSSSSSRDGFRWTPTSPSRRPGGP